MRASVDYSYGTCNNPNSGEGFVFYYESCDQFEEE